MSDYLMGLVSGLLLAAIILILKEDMKQQVKKEVAAYNAFGKPTE